MIRARSLSMALLAFGPALGLSQTDFGPATFPVPDKKIPCDAKAWEKQFKAVSGHYDKEQAVIKITWKLHTKNSLKLPGDFDRFAWRAVFFDAVSTELSYVHVSFTPGKQYQKGQTIEARLLEIPETDLLQKTAKVVIRHINRKKMTAQEIGRETARLKVIHAKRKAQIDLFQRFVDQWDGIAKQTKNVGLSVTALQNKIHWMQQQSVAADVMLEVQQRIGQLQKP